MRPQAHYFETFNCNFIVVGFWINFIWNEIHKLLNTTALHHNEDINCTLLKGYLKPGNLKSEVKNFNIFFSFPFKISHKDTLNNPSSVLYFKNKWNYILNKHVCSLSVFLRTFVYQKERDKIRGVNHLMLSNAGIHEIRLQWKGLHSSPEKDMKNKRQVLVCY